MKRLYIFNIFPVLNILETTKNLEFIEIKNKKRTGSPSLKNISIISLNKIYFINVISNKYISREIIRRLLQSTNLLIENRIKIKRPYSVL